MIESIWNTFTEWIGHQIQSFWNKVIEYAPIIWDSISKAINNVVEYIRKG